MERHAGSVVDGRLTGAHDHVCWAFTERADFVKRAVEFLEEGRSAGALLVYVGSAEPDELAGELAPLGDVPGLLASGALIISSLGRVYPSGAVIDPGDQVEEYRRRTRDAVAAGYSGLRVAADATAMVVTPEQRRAFGRYEQMVDRLMAVEPLSALCGFDRSALGEETIAQLACLHPAEGGFQAPFHVFALDSDRHALTGECDIASERCFEWALDGLVTGGHDLRLDLRGSRFVDHRALVALDHRAGAVGRRVVLEGVSPTTRKVVSILGLCNLTVGAPA